MQQYADIYLLQNHSTCFGCLPHPSSGVHKTVTAASGTGHIWATYKDLKVLIWLRWRNNNNNNNYYYYYYYVRYTHLVYAEESDQRFHTFKISKYCLVTVLYNNN